MSAEKEDQNMTSPPASKKLKQARLPFKLLTPKADSPPQMNSSNQQKKRKLSDTIGGPQKAAKSAKNDENSPKHNKRNNSLDAENEVSSSSETQNLQQNPPCQDVKRRVVGILDKFVRTTQQREVSTSCEHEPIDLTESDNEAEGKEVGICQLVTPKSTSNTVSPRSSWISNDVEQVPSETSSLNSTGDSFDMNFRNESPEIGSVGSDNEMNVEVSSNKVSSAKEMETQQSLNNSSFDHSMDSDTKNPKKDTEKSGKQREKDEAKAEKEKQKKGEKERKEFERLEAKKKREEERQRLLGLKQKDKEEKLRIKEEERKKKQQEKDEEKKKKQDLIEARNEDKRKKEEEKIKAGEEEKAKKEKVKAMFSKYFTKSGKQGIQAKMTVETRGPFIAFELKKDMKIAPRIRVQEDIHIQKVVNLDKYLIEEISTSSLYLDDLHRNKFIPGKSHKTWPYERDNDVEVLEKTKQSADTMRAKLLQFCENHRPAYYGTWKKRSEVVHARHPFIKDEDTLDYDVDSDDEWEEEEPGESLSNSEGEDSEEEKETSAEGDDDDEDGFFVPHGYLSEGEGCDDDDEVSPESLKAKQLARAKAWDAEMKGRKKCEVLKPVCFGLFWSCTDPDYKRDPTWDKLQQYTAIPMVPLPIRVQSESITEDASPSNEGQERKKKKKEHTNLMPVPEEAIPDLLRLVHGNIFGIKKLVKEFQVYWYQKTLGYNLVTMEEVGSTQTVTLPASEDLQLGQSDDTKDNNAVDLKYNISKRQLDSKIRELAVYEKRESFKKTCWYVQTEILDQYKMMESSIPTKWHWLTKPNKPKRDDTKLTAPGTPNVANPKKAHPAMPNIKQFAVPGYTPPMVVSSPYSHNRISNDKSDDVPPTSPNSEIKLNNFSDTPKRAHDSMTPSALFKHNSKTDLLLTENQSAATRQNPIKSPMTKRKNQRSLKSMFSPPPSKKKTAPSDKHVSVSRDSSRVEQGLKPGDCADLPMEID